MTGLFIGLYGIYLVLVGAQGNTQTLLSDAETDIPDYLPWLLAIIAISVLTEFEATQKLVKPFIVLLVLNFFLRNFSTVKSQLTSIYTSATAQTVATS